MSLLIFLCFCFYIALSFVQQGRVAVSVRPFVLRSTVLTLLLLSALLINRLVPPDDIMGSASTLSSTILFALVAALLCSAFLLYARGRWRYLSILFLTPLLFSWMFLWGYFFHARHWPNGDVFVALWQTTPAEALAFWRVHFGFAGTLALVAALAGCALFIRWFSKMRGRPLTTRRERCFAMTSIACHMMLFLFFCAAGNASIYSQIGSEGVYAVQQLAMLRAHTEEHADELARMERIQPGSGGLHLLVIGESENRGYMHAYGGPEGTTPWLDAMKESLDCILFPQAYSNHVHTVAALAYALTEKNQYNDVDLAHAYSIIEVAKAAGYRTIWLSNQGKNGYADTATTITAETADDARFLNEHQSLDVRTYDGQLVAALDEALSSLDTPDAFIVIHLMGCHEDYPRRYPADGVVFDTQTRTGAYENAVRYNDDILHQIYEHARRAPAFRDLVYFSDHGEAVASGHAHESSMYEPCMTYIPFYIIFSDTGRAARPEAFAALRENAYKPWTNDLAYEVLVTLLGITPPHAIEPRNNLASPAYDGDLARLRTCHGEREITPDN